MLSGYIEEPNVKPNSLSSEQDPSCQCVPKAAETSPLPNVTSTLDPSPTFSTYRQLRATIPSTIKIRPVPKFNDEITDVMSYGLLRTASIDSNQPARLQPGRWLTNSLVDLHAYEVANTFFEGNPHRAGDLCLLPTVTWYHAAENTNDRPDFGRLDPKVSPLEYKFVAFPANGTGCHFFLGIIAFASDLLVRCNPSGPVRTSIFVFDSLGTSYETSNLQGKMNQFVLRLALDEKLRLAELKAIVAIRVKVPKQPNTTDCGLYPGHFLSIFLSDPEAYTAHCKGETIMNGTVDEIWQAGSIETTRRVLLSLVNMATRYRLAATRFNSNVSPSSHVE
ncbi:hypothetical protein M407DRAFT_33331 [Tulasnella calospora MUT 4182]|uniref:Ubiquitin-like protease family profile domain-containing protein n=1 Tax=Tulasnella calospora MUT 4182 TaxID=1051891 RepID=A0A0C3K6L5_9AGAM|nr:hypothetical protein M407DRAFT_33331 [Tulasnella calospora MUT 4182]